MIPTADTLLARLDTLMLRDGPPARLLVGYSGGRDSTVLLHALATHPRGAVPLVALHVNHGLQADADAFETHCRARAAALGVAFESRRVTVDRASPTGIEAAARMARYAALADTMRPGDWLLTAHHADDQAETLLMNLMRGSGAAGLAGIAEIRPLGPGQLVRPLLAQRAEDLDAYAAARALDWLDDPSNADTAFDRNFLRQRVLPLLKARWPAGAASAAESARLAGETTALLDELAGLDLETAGTPQRLELSALASLSAPRQRNLLRHAARRAGLPPPPSRQLDRILEELVPARADAAPRVRWPGGEARRYRGVLYLLPAHGGDPAAPDAMLTPDAPLALGDSQGTLALEPGDSGIDRELAASGLRVEYREGGEAIRTDRRECTHKLKKLFQEQGVVPWMRSRIPLLYAGDSLVAVGDLWIAAEHRAAGGFVVRWQERPPLY